VEKVERRNVPGIRKEGKKRSTGVAEKPIRGKFWGIFYINKMKI